MQGDNIIYLTSASTLPQKGSPLIRIFGEKGGNITPLFSASTFPKEKGSPLIGSFGEVRGQCNPFIFRSVVWLTIHWKSTVGS